METLVKVDSVKRVKDIIVLFPVSGEYMKIPVKHCLIVTENGERIGFEIDDRWKVKYGPDS